MSVLYIVKGVKVVAESIQDAYDKYLELTSEK